MFKRVLAGAMISSALLIPAVRSASAAPAAKAEHCVQHVTGQKASGELEVSSARCYSTFQQAMRAEGVDAWGDGASARAAQLEASQPGAALLSFTLGTHYDLTNFNPAGGSTSTVGTGCTGGWLNTSAGVDEPDQQHRQRLPDDHPLRRLQPHRRSTPRPAGSVGTSGP